MTETEARVENHPCAVCGQQDDHPMIHIWGDWKKEEQLEGQNGTITFVRDPSVHFDCLPEEFAAMLYDDNGNPLPQHAKTVALRDAALDGVHGDDLVSLEKTLETDNDVDPEGHMIVPGMDVIPQSNVEA